MLFSYLISLIYLLYLDDICTANLFVRGKLRIPYTSEERVEKKIFELALIWLVIALEEK